MKKLFDMSFSEFAEVISPSGAVNRFPSIGAGADVFSYSVYMNGPMLGELPIHARQHEFKDVMLHALTEKLQLNPGSPRDNLKVAEMVATRSTWMSAVLEHSCEPGVQLSEQMKTDYEQLTNGLTHPWIAGELAKQKELSAKLQPALSHAGKVAGRTIVDRAPNEVSIGKVLAQDLDFTVQETNEGDIVTHENRRLKALPLVGAEVMVSYYRGSGQVVDSLENVKVSDPFIEPESGDLAVMLTDGRGEDQVVLFNSLAGFDKFVKAHGMDNELVHKAMNVREATPKAVAPVPVRKLVSDVYVEDESGCLGIEYEENGVTYSALFANAQQMSAVAKEFGFGQKELDAGKALESAGYEMADERESVEALRADLARMGYLAISESPSEGKTYMGKIVAENALHVAQDLGRRNAVIHDLRALDKVATVGDSLTVKYENGRGKVTEVVRDSQGLGR